MSNVWSPGFGGMLLSARGAIQESLGVFSLGSLLRISSLDPPCLRPQAYLAGGHLDGWVRRRGLDEIFLWFLDSLVIFSRQ